MGPFLLFCSKCETASDSLYSSLVRSVFTRKTRTTGIGGVHVNVGNYDAYRKFFARELAKRKSDLQSKAYAYARADMIKFVKFVEDHSGPFGDASEPAPLPSRPPERV